MQLTEDPARAEELLHAGRQSAPDPGTAQLCLLTKRPHAAGDQAVTAVLARLLAAGVRVHEVRRLRRDEDAAGVVEALYPVAHAHFTNTPTSAAVWEALRKRFDDDRFAAVFGVPYSPELVVSGSEAIALTGIDEQALTAIWEEGRRPISRDVLAARYGTAVADVLSPDGSHLSWFRGAWPLGIQRIASGLMAFALRHEQLDGGRPMIVLNGHVPGLAELFGAGTAIIEAGLPVSLMSVSDLRRRVIGHDNRPQSCEPGTIRRDAADGLLPLDTTDPVDSRRNVVHCSDGLLAGVLETRALLGTPAHQGALADRLTGGGLTAEEIETIILRDPVVREHGAERTLSESTRGLSLDECAAVIARAFPPVFGAANGFASGLGLTTFARAVRELVAEVVPETRVPVAGALRPGDLVAREAAGLAAIAAGQVGFVAPAGGTGGRFGGYDLPESHPSRQKALVPAFRAGERAVCALDIRLANARYWRLESNGRLPVAVMASPSSAPAVSDWARRAGDPDLVTYTQTGIYRLRADVDRNRWFDGVLREDDGTPSLKPPGNIGTLTCLALSGILDAWAEQGVEFLAIANGDDVGFRLDPRIVGLLTADPSVDVVVAGVPWGLSGVLVRPDGRVHVRVENGRCVDEAGRTGHAYRTGHGGWEAEFEGARGPLTSVAADRGGAICELRTGDGWRIGIVEGADPDAFAAPVLFSTNQYCVRISALREALDLSSDIVGDVRRFLDRRPFLIERKQVNLDGVATEALQLVQGMNAVFGKLRLVATRLSRYGDRESRSSYAALKHPEDVAFGQSLLDDMARDGDDLRW